MHLRRVFALLALLAAALPGFATSPARPVVLDVDAREAPRRILHARERIPAAPGPLTLLYPKWVPGEHMPSGPIEGLAGLRFTAGGKELPWRRDDVDMWAFHVEVPAGADSVEVSLDSLQPSGEGRFSAGVSSTDALTVVSWNQVLLYPKGTKSDDPTVRASLKLPPGWKFGTALPVASESSDGIAFAPVSLTTLVDSPVIAGSHFRTIDLGGGSVPHRICAASDGDAALQAPPPLVEGFRALVAETGALFGARHYRSYSFLVTLSDHATSFGLEHHESSDDRMKERAWVDEDRRRLFAGLLPHEMTHSWNGKYRRPVGLATGDFDTPMKGELLWVYEGLTDYLGHILTARSGLWTPEEYREFLALTAAEMEAHKGRTWRPLEDTAVAAQFLYAAPPEWTAWRRSVDFYPEGDLLWLEADALIQRESHGRRSLDDFCRLFLGGESGPPKVVPYTFDDLVAALGKILPYDWRGFWTKRLDEAEKAAPLGGIEAAGWKLSTTDRRPVTVRSWESVSQGVDARASLGFLVMKDGTVPDVFPGSPGEKAGLAPGMRIVAVNSRRFSDDRLRDAIRETEAGRPIELIAENAEAFRVFRLEYTGGERYPALERIPGAPDLLSDIIRARVPHPSPPPASPR